MSNMIVKQETDIIINVFISMTFALSATWIWKGTFFAINHASLSSQEALLDNAPAYNDSTRSTFSLCPKRFP